MVVWPRLRLALHRFSLFGLALKQNKKNGVLAPASLAFPSVQSLWPRPSPQKKTTYSRWNFTGAFHVVRLWSFEIAMFLSHYVPGFALNSFSYASWSNIYTTPMPPNNVRSLVANYIHHSQASKQCSEPLGQLYTPLPCLQTMFGAFWPSIYTTP